jgi:hypothetical protein
VQTKNRRDLKEGLKSVRCLNRLFICPQLPRIARELGCVTKKEVKNENNRSGAFSLRSQALQCSRKEPKKVSSNTFLGGLT